MKMNDNMVDAAAMAVDDRPQWAQTAVS